MHDDHFQLKKFMGSLVRAGDVDNSLRELFANPRLALELYAPEKLEKLDKATRKVEICRRIAMSAILMVIAIAVLITFPKDMEIERNRLKVIHNRKIEKCRSEYSSNNCNSTTFPKLKKRCQELEKCMTEKAPVVLVSEYTWTLMNNFFEVLTPKSSAILGSFLGVIIYAYFLR